MDEVFIHSGTVHLWTSNQQVFLHDIIGQLQRKLTSHRKITLLLRFCTTNQIICLVKTLPQFFKRLGNTVTYTKSSVSRAIEPQTPLTEIINTNFISRRYCINMSIQSFNILSSLGQFSKLSTFSCELFSIVIFPFFMQQPSKTKNIAALPSKTATYNSTHECVHVRISAIFLHK